MSAPLPLVEVFRYDIDRLVALIAEASYSKSEEEIRSKAHIKYLEGYLAHLQARTLVVERPYIDRDFLEDYAAYYVRCFPQYEKTCARIHVFKETFDGMSLNSCLVGDEGQLSTEKLQQAYLGFIVIKPLPQTVIGRTCLTAYETTQTRSFPPARNHEFMAHLFGIALKVPCSLPFQEQDSVVAACATSALWTVFQATARAFQHQLLSPIEITKAATHLLPTETRVIPNRGLSHQMMAHAIRSVNLEPLLVQVSEAYLLQTAIYSYVHSRIPMILGVVLTEGDDNCLVPFGNHAVAVTGYSLDGKPTPVTSSGLLLRASRMDKIYVHDDQVGPFARMELLNHGVKVKQGNNFVDVPAALSTSFPTKSGKARAIPSMLLVPLYHKMRISWEWALGRVTEIDAFLTQLTAAEHTLNLTTLEWDVYVTTVNEVRADLRRKGTIPRERMLTAITQPMPRFIWRATACRNEHAVIDLMFDATDVEAGHALVQVEVYDAKALAFLQGLAKAGDPQKLPFQKSVRDFVSWFGKFGT